MAESQAMIKSRWLKAYIQQKRVVKKSSSIPQLYLSKRCLWWICGWNGTTYHL